MNCRKDRDVIQYHTGRLTDRSEGTVYVKNVCIGGFVFMKKWETIREFIMITFATVIVAAAVFTKPCIGGKYIRSGNCSGKLCSP